MGERNFGVSERRMRKETSRKLENVEKLVEKKDVSREIKNRWGRETVESEKERGKEEGEK